MATMKVALVSTYELGRQPFGLASPAAWLRQAGASVGCLDLAVEDLDEQMVGEAALIAVHLPMHTATRLAAALTPRLRALNANAHLCFFGLYAPMNADYLRRIGGDSIIGGEFEHQLLALYRRLATASGNGVRIDDPISMAKQDFRLPDRRGLPALTRYAHLQLGGGARRVVGHTEASRGCKHRCRHCPVVPVYDGRFFVVARDIVLADIDQQVAAGAQHISFGDPDFFNGPGHAMAIVEALHAAHPDLSYDVTIKIEHLLDHADKLERLVATGCLFVTTAVESVDDAMLARLDKGHTHADFERAAALARAAGLDLSPTFIPFTPWTTLEGYGDLLRAIARLDLVEQVAPVQLVIRLLVPQGSRLLELDAMRAHLGAFDAAALSYPWSHPDPAVDGLQQAVCAAVEQAGDAPRAETFAAVWRLTNAALGRDEAPPKAAARFAPRLSEPWYCCAEPTGDQLARL